MENQTIPSFYNEEIDIRVYIQALLKNWLWIVLPAVGAVVTSFLLLTLQPSTYKATSLVSVSAPSLNVNFDTRINTIGETGGSNLQNNDLPSLALSDALMFELFNNVKDQLPESIANYADLADQLDATTETRSEIVTLSGTFEDPELSAIIINEWGRIFVRIANEFFEGSVDASQQFLVEQLEAAATERDQIDAEWTAFQAQNESALLLAELESQKSLQQTYINRRSSLEILQYDIQGIKTQIDQNPDDENVLSDLTLYALQNRAFGTSGDVQFEITSFDVLSASTFQARVAQLDNLEIAAAAQQAELTARINEIDPIVLDLQEQISALSIASLQLETNRDIVLSTFETLARKVAEGAIEQNDTTGRAQIASEAIIPAEAQPRGRVTTGGISAVGIAAVAAIIILALTWWREENKRTKQEISIPSSVPAND